MQYRSNQLALLVGSTALATAVSFTPAKATDVFSTLMEGGFAEASNWKVTLGGGLLVAPKYEGSKKFGAMPLPYVDIVWKDTLFLNPIRGLGVNVVSYEGLTAGAALGYDFGRKEKDSKSELAGMGKVKAGATATGFLSYNLGFAKAETSVTKHFGGSKGVTVDVGVKSFIPVSVLMGEGMPEVPFDKSAPGHGMSGPAISLGVSAQWADKKYMKDYFGVSAAQAVTSSYSAFNAKAGFKSVSVETGVFVPVTDHVLVGSTVTYSRLIGDAEKSPLSRNDNQLSGTAFVTYSF